MINEREIGRHIQDGGLKQQTIWRNLRESQDVEETILELEKCIVKYNKLIVMWKEAGEIEFAFDLAQRIKHVHLLIKELHDKS